MSKMLAASTARVRSLLTASRSAERYCLHASAPATAAKSSSAASARRATVRRDATGAPSWPPGSASGARRSGSSRRPRAVILLNSALRHRALTLLERSCGSHAQLSSRRTPRGGGAVTSARLRSPRGPPRRFVDVVTGRSSGIGRAIALRFADEGAHVVVADVAPRAARGRREHRRAVSARAARHIEADVSRAADVERLVARRASSAAGSTCSSPTRSIAGAPLEGAARDDRGGLGRDHGRQPARRLPLLHAPRSRRW